VIAPEKRPAVASRGMVVTNHLLGSAAGAEMLAALGNAVDAAMYRPVSDGTRRI
jgi:gamma-glutamyltranspeptidase/glutathione hydrolase